MYLNTREEYKIIDDLLVSFSETLGISKSDLIKNFSDMPDFIRDSVRPLLKKQILNIEELRRGSFLDKSNIIVFPYCSKNNT